MQKYINVRPVIVIDGPNAHQVWLDVGCQHFTVGDYLETKDEAEWFAGQLETALDEMLPTYANQQLDSLISDMEQQAKTFLNTENTEIFGWIRRLKAWQAAKREPVVSGEAVAELVEAPDKYSGIGIVFKAAFDALPAGTKLYTHPPEAMAKDAERYRFLRSRLQGNAYREIGVIYSEGMSGIDEAIDAVMTTTPRGG